MDAVAEREVAVVRAPEVEPVRLPELGRVAVGGVDHQEEAIPSPDVLVADPEVLAGDAHHRRSGAVVAQQLLDGRGAQRRILTPGPRFGRVPEQGQRPVPDEVRRRLVTREEQQHAARDQLRLAETLASLARHEEGRHEIVGRGVPAAGDDTLEVVPHLGNRARRPLVLVGCPERAPDEARQLVRPRLELLVILGRNAQEVSDHRHGQRIREVPDQVHLPGRGRAVQQELHDLRDPRAPRLDRARGERAPQRVAESRVHRRIREHDPEPDVTQERLDGLAGGGRLPGQEGRDPIGREPRIREARPDVRVARQHPAAQDPAPVNRVLLAEAAERGIRIRHDVGPSRVVRDQLRIRSPRGSQSGSAATSPSTHSPKNSTATAVPGAASSTGRYAYAMDRPSEYPNPPLVTRPTTWPATRTGSPPSATQPGSERVRHASFRRTPAAFWRASDVAPEELPFPELDREAEPGLVRRVVGRDVGAPVAVSLLEPEGVDGAIAGGHQAVRPARLPQRVPQLEPVLGRRVELPAELPHVRDPHRERRGCGRPGSPAP